MEDHDQGRSGLKEQTKSLYLNRKSREASVERQTSARESQVAELRSVEVATTAKSTRPAKAIESPPDVKLDLAFASILKKKVYLSVDTENALSKSHRRIKHLEEQLQQKTVPKGLKIKPVRAKSKSEDLQKFDNILHEAELRLLDVTLESLRKEVLETEHSIALCKEDIKATIDRWRSSFPLKDKKSTGKADLLAKYAHKFVDDFYFQCMANKTSKAALLDALSKEEKAKIQPGMETEFTLTEESVQDIVQAEVQHLSSQKGPQNARGRSGRNGMQTPNDGNKSQRRGRSSSKGKTIASVAKAQAVKQSV